MAAIFIDMKTSQKILVFFAKIGSTLYLGLGIYLLWSTIHRITSDRQWRKVVLDKFTTIEAASKKMTSFVWIADGASELFDAVCTPQKVQAVGFDGSSPHGNDCDEEGIYLANTLQVPGITPYFFTVTWYEPETGKFAGHNVCLLESVEGFRYMDYGMPSRYLWSIKEVAELVIKDYAGWDTTGHGTQPAVLITALVSSPKMRPIKILL